MALSLNDADEVMRKLLLPELRRFFGDLPPNGLIRSLEDYEKVLTYLANSKEIAVDTETTGLHPYGGDELRGVSVATVGHHWYIPVSHPGTTNLPITPLLEELVEHDLIFHHCVFDWAFLEIGGGRGDTLTATTWDTQVGNWLMDENLRVGLKESAERILGFDASEEKRALKKLTKETGRTWGTFTGEDIADYAAMDARLTYDLWRWQSGLFDLSQNLAMRRELAVQRGIFRMNRTGIKVDLEHINRKIEETEDFLEEMSATFEKHDVNPRSPKDVARWLYDDLGYECQIMTKTGARSTNRAALTSLALESEEADALLRQRTLQKELSAYYRPLRSAAIHSGGIIHPHFSSTRTVTGRFSCSDPNLQTIPRDDVMSDVRKCFVPRVHGFTLVEFDLNQAELRVIAGYTKEQNMIDALMDPERNLHDETALAVFGPDYTPLQRRLAKNLNFGFPYGIGPEKFATYLAPVPSRCVRWTDEGRFGKTRKCETCDVCKADQILRGYRKAYPSLTNYMNGLARYADTHGRIPLEVPGRFRHFRGAGYRVPGYTALNAIVQGGIGEFMKDIMVEWYDHAANLMDPCLVLQIHDALVFEVPENYEIETLRLWLQGTADRISPFALPMVWEMKEWK